VLSSACLFRAALSAEVAFACTRVVIYECLYKPRKTVSDADSRLQDRIRAAQKASEVTVYPIDIDDLQMVTLLENRKRLGKGELSTIAFAMKTRQVVLTDDQKARRLVAEIMSTPAQTTPHLFGWLFFNNGLTDSDKATVIREHESMGRPLAAYFESAYMEACRCRLMAAQRIASND
jgi:predicted nucleic acid-binding protein